MSSRLNMWGACRGLAVRTRPITPQNETLLRIAAQRRFASDSAGKSGSGEPKVDSRLKSMNQGSLQKRASAKAPETSQSTQELRAMFDKALADSALSSIPGSTASSAEFVHVPGGLTEAQAEVLYHEGRIPPAAQADKDLATIQNKGAEESKPDHKFPLPELPLPPNSQLKERYHPVLGQFVRLLMRDGKLSRAQRQLAAVLNILRTSPPPILSPRYPLIPGAPPPSHLPLNPVLYLTVAIDSVSPLIKIRHLAGAAGGGQALDIPFPMEVRQRRRSAFKWIIDVVDKKPSRGSGRMDFPTRLAEEIVAVVEGRSSVWEKRQQVHKSGTVARANLNTFHGGKKGHRIIV